jgi:putative intracellular protease/amidase
MDIVIFIFDGFTALDAVGPYEVFSRMPGARVRFAAKQAGPCTTDNGMLKLIAEETISKIDRADLLCVSGGLGSRALMRDPETLDWTRRIHPTTQWTTSVCTGSLILGGAGLLKGLRATTHWRAMDLLKEFGATPVNERVVEEGKIVTAAGVSSGIDMALRLAQKIHGAESALSIQRSMEYDPQPLPVPVPAS